MKEMKDLSWKSPYKIIHHLDKINELKKGENIYPIQIEIHPTLVCNHKCKNCITNVVNIRDYEKMSVVLKRDEWIEYDKFISLINEFAEVGVKTITLSGGGEPLIYPKIENILRLIREKGMGFGIITNLSIKLNASLLSELKHAEWIRVSLDAADKETHSLLHGTREEDFNLVINNIKKISESCFVGINYLVQKENYKDIFKAALLAKKLRVDYIRFTPLYEESLGKYYINIWDEIDKEMDKAKELEDEKLSIFNFKQRFQSLLTNNKSYKECWIHRFHPILGADLKIYTCCNFPYVKKYAICDLRNKTFKEAWNSKERLDFIKNLNPQKCPSCWYDEQNKIIDYLVLEKPKHKDFV